MKGVGTTQYKITLTEEQMKVVMRSLEFRARILMGQEFDLANDLAFYDVDMSPDNPKHKEIFDAAIQCRDALSEVAKAMFRIAYPPYGTPQKKGDEVCEALTVWDAVRTALGINFWGKPYQQGSEPIPTIENRGGD